MPEPSFADLLDAMKQGAQVLRDNDIPFLLGGGLASWARGGPPTEHDVDFAIANADVDRALDAFEARGCRTERPPEGWLVKTWVGDVMIDLMHHPSGLVVDADTVAAADELQVNAMPMKVMSADDILVTKLLSLTEHEMDLESVLEIARALREQIDWPSLRERTKASPYAAAFFTLVDELGVSAA